MTFLSPFNIKFKIRFASSIFILVNLTLSVFCPLIQLWLISITRGFYWFSNALRTFVPPNGGNKIIENLNFRQKFSLKTHCCVFCLSVCVFFYANLCYWIYFYGTICANTRRNERQWLVREFTEKWSNSVIYAVLIWKIYPFQVGRLSHRPSPILKLKFLFESPKKKKLILFDAAAQNFCHKNFYRFLTNFSASAGKTFT